MNRKETVLKWPENDDRNQAWVPYEEILCVINPPEIESGGRQYRLSKMNMRGSLSCTANGRSTEYSYIFFSFSMNTLLKI